MSAKEAGQTFLEQLLAHVPADKQAAAREALAESDAALNELGAATLRQSEFSRLMDQARAAQANADAHYTANAEWFAANKAALEEAARLKAGGSPTPTPNPIQTPAASLTREDLDREIAAASQQAVAAIVTTNQLSARHMMTFKEVLDMPKLMADPEIHKLGLTGVYDKHYKSKYDELATKAENDRIEAEVQKRVAEQRAQFTQMPYPVSGHEPSPLDGIERLVANPPDPTKPVTPPVGSTDVVAAAVAQYNAALAKSFGQPTI